MQMSIIGSALLVTALVVVAAPLDALQRHKWWESGDIKAEIGISDAQSEAIESVYQASRPTLRTLMDELSTEEEVLSVLVDAPDATEAAVEEQIEKVEAARGALSKERLLMVYRMHRELSAKQRDDLRQWMDENRRRTRR